MFTIGGNNLMESVIYYNIYNIVHRRHRTLRKLNPLQQCSNTYVYSLFYNNMEVADTLPSIDSWCRGDE